MADVLIRNLDQKVISALKSRARRNRRSLQAELADILERESQVPAVDPRTFAEQIRRRFAGRKHTDSVDVLNQDRSR